MANLTEKITRPLVVSKKIRETEDAYSFVFSIPKELQNEFKYKAGQFVTFFLNINGEEIHRSYSLSTAPSVEPDFKVTVKRVEGGKGSTFLVDQVKEGDTLRVTPPAGSFFKSLPESDPAEFFLFAAGSGITPIFSILKEVIHRNKSNKVQLLFANRDEDSVIYAEELRSLEKKFPNQLDVTHILSQPQTEVSCLTGRCEDQIVKNYTLANRSDSLPQRYYMCGPVGFMEMVRLGLEAAGIERREIYEESFGEAPLESHKPPIAHNLADKDLDGKLVVGDPTIPRETPEKIVATIDGEQVEVEAEPDESILETLINAGQNPPYSCMDGACMACMAKLESGRIYQDDPGILTDENVEAHEILTCQAKPLSKIVTVNYDSF